VRPAWGERGGRGSGGGAVAAPVGIHTPLGWLGSGRLTQDALVLIDADGHVAWSGYTGDRPTRGPLAGEPEEAYRVDGFLMPGVVDWHVHMGLVEPPAVLRGGVTAVRDLGWPPEAILPLAHRSREPAFDGPLIDVVGPMLTCRGGYPTSASWAPPGTGVEVTGADDAAAVVARVLAQSTVPVVKVALNADVGPVLLDEELVAICGAAREAGAEVTVHAQGPGQAERALGAGADEFAHCPWSERLSDDVVEAAARRMRIVSTLDIHSRGRDTPELRTALDNLRRFMRAGGSARYGTDLGNGELPQGIHAGEAAHLEAAGLEGEALLGAMSPSPLDAGAPADLVVLRGNPLDDMRELGDPVFVMRAGRRVR
jgi:imidazolonepropionase-like amidohydrolase